MPKILLADDSESLRAALKDVLSQQEGWTIVGEATNGRSAVSLSIELKPDLIILDFLMPLMNGIAAAGEILRAVPGVPIVLYTMHMSTQLEREAKRVGITKVVSKTERFDAFIDGLNEVLVKKEAPIGPLGLCATDIAAPHDLSGCQSETAKKPDDIPPS